MNKLVAVTAIAFSILGWPAFGAEPPVAPATPAAGKAPGEVKIIPMHSRADVIDIKARFFITKRKDGVDVKNTVPNGVEINQGPTPAKLEDIKVGDYVSGSRKQVSKTEYTVVKITKFGPYSEKKAAEAKPGCD